MHILVHRFESFCYADHTLAMMVLIITVLLQDDSSILSSG